MRVIVLQNIIKVMKCSEYGWLINFPQAKRKSPNGPGGFTMSGRLRRDDMDLLLAAEVLSPAEVLSCAGALLFISNLSVWLYDEISLTRPDAESLSSVELDRTSDLLLGPSNSEVPFENCTTLGRLLNLLSLGVGCSSMVCMLCTSALGVLCIPYSVFHVI